MENESLQTEPYRPNVIHRLFNRVERLPGPYWLYYAGIIVITGALNHIVAWRERVLAPGEISWRFAFTAFYLAYYLFTNDSMFRVARESLVEFRPILDASEEGFDRIVFQRQGGIRYDGVKVYFDCFSKAVALFAGTQRTVKGEQVSRRLAIADIAVRAMKIGAEFMELFAFRDKRYRYETLSASCLLSIGQCRGSLSVALLCHHENVLLVFDDFHPDNIIISRKRNAANSSGRPSHRSYVGL